MRHAAAPVHNGRGCECLGYNVLWALACRACTTTRDRIPARGHDLASARAASKTGRGRARDDVFTLQVMTGFRVARGCAQEHFGIMPDICTMGKVIGGGLPVGAFGGKREIMETVAPAGPMYQSGTLSGNPLAMISGIKTLEILDRPGAYEQLDKVTAKLIDGILAAGKKHNIPVTGGHIGGARLSGYVSCCMHAL
jgi:Aminotransferase class-III